MMDHEILDHMTMIYLVLAYNAAEVIDIATEQRYNMFKNKFKINLKIGAVRFEIFPHFIIYMDFIQFEIS